MRCETIAAVSLCGLLGCGIEGRDEPVTVEQNELGITQLTVERGVWEDTHRSLRIHGFNSSGEEIARLTSLDRIAPYFWKPGMPLLAGPEGWEIDVTVKGASFTRKGLVPLAERAPDVPALSAFVLMKEVAAAVQSDTGIVFTKPYSAGELAYSATNCTGSDFPSAMGDPPQCCQDGGQQWLKPATGNNAGKVTQRTHSNACSSGGGNFSCGIDSNGGNHGTCAFGPNGWRPDGLVISNPWDLNEDGVFHPDGSYASQCGRSNGEGYYVPGGLTNNWYSGVDSSAGDAACCFGGVVVGDESECHPTIPEPSCLMNGESGCNSIPCCDSNSQCDGDQCLYEI